MNIFSETHAFFPPGEDYSYVEGRVCRSGVGNLAKVKTPRPLLLMASTESAAAAVVVEVPSRSLNGQFSKSALPKNNLPSSLPAPSLPLMQHKGHIFPGVEPTRPQSDHTGCPYEQVHTGLL